MRKFILCLCLFMQGLTLQTFALNKIPTLYIQTQDGKPILSRDEWKDQCVFSFVLPDSTVAFQSSKVSIKARGHSTFSKPKKPFVFKLDRDFGFSGMKPGKNWLLLANFMDHSNIRNSLALAIARQTDLDWTPEDRFVDVVINGKPQGCYLRTKGIEVGEECIRLHPGDCLLEGDDYRDIPTFFRTSYRKLPFNVQYPEAATPEQMKDIQNRMDRIEQLLYSGSDKDRRLLYDQYLDIRSFADWWIVHELTQNAEPNGPRSCYMHWLKGKKIKAGPVWDFDLAFIDVGVDREGNIRPSRFDLPDVRALTGDSLYNPTALWYDRLLKDPKFTTTVKKRWNQLKPKFERLADQIDRWDEQIRPSALENEQLWYNQAPARFDTFEHYTASIQHLKQTYLYRIKSLDKLFNAMK
ncbi:MAG: CotH kinase family protein [Paraprevotella sp.]|nr:CotH kinase family protein [Paraprevotella sp.]